MVTKLQVYNKALQLVGSRALASLTENRESRRQLDTAWAADAVGSCLEEGYWGFAMRTVKLEANPSIDPDFGLRYAFDQPEDCIRPFMVSLDDHFSVPFENYADERGYWWADAAPLYVRYVSDDDRYGRNLGSWPPSFTEYVSTFLASKVVGVLSQSSAKISEVEEKLRRAKISANSKDAMKRPVQRSVAGSWVRARRGRYSSYGPKTDVIY